MNRFFVLVFVMLLSACSANSIPQQNQNPSMRPPQAAVPPSNFGASYVIELHSISATGIQDIRRYLNLFDAHQGSKVESVDKELTYIHCNSGLPQQAFQEQFDTMVNELGDAFTVHYVGNKIIVSRRGDPAMNSQDDLDSWR